MAKFSKQVTTLSYDGCEVKSVKLFGFGCLVSMLKPGF